MLDRRHPVHGGTVAGVPGLIVVNPDAGSRPTETEVIRGAFVGHQVEPCAPGRLGEATAAAMSDDGRQLSFVGVAGGDGSVRAVAEHLVGTDIPLLVIPTGTRNHLAADLGIDSLERARRAADHATVRRIDVGRVNDQIFLNTFNLGIYPKLVELREQHGQLPEPVANLVAAARQVHTAHRTRITIDDDDRLVWVVFVGNGCYGDGFGDLVARESLDDGVLDIRVVRADGPMSRLGVAGTVLLGRLDRSPRIERSRATTLRLEPKEPVVRAALDGEVVHLDAPLEVRCDPRSLAVLVPPADHSPSGGS